jgi:hypothetical protein
MHQQLWRYKVEEKIHPQVRERKSFWSCKFHQTLSRMVTFLFYPSTNCGFSYYLPPHTYVLHTLLSWSLLSSAGTCRRRASASGPLESNGTSTMFTNRDYADIHFVFTYGNCSATEAAEERRHTLPNRRTPNRYVRVFIVFTTSGSECHYTYTGKNAQHNSGVQENILCAATRLPRTRTRRISSHLARHWRILQHITYTMFHLYTCNSTLLLLYGFSNGLTAAHIAVFLNTFYSRTSNNGHCRGIQILSVRGGVR